MQTTLRMIWFAGIGLVREDGQDGIGTALRDLAAKPCERLREHTPRLVHERGELLARQAATNRREVVQARVQEGRVRAAGPLPCAMAARTRPGGRGRSNMIAFCREHKVAILNTLGRFGDRVLLVAEKATRHLDDAKSSSFLGCILEVFSSHFSTK
ncbi:MAG TPA: hypothetical protein VKD22_10050 [Ramlibacter sp.]|nr:hypothetical protein [Ramlibacter sp.]